MTDTPPGAQTLTPPADKKDTTEKKDAAPKDKKDEHLDKARAEQDKIDAANPRFKEVYGKMKAHERALEEKEKDIEALREHTMEMERRLAELASKKADRKPDPEPDKDLEPAAHKKWVAERRAEEEEQRKVEHAQERLARQIEVQRDLHEDYEDVVKAAERAMAKDKALHKKVWESENPSRAAYRLGKELAEKASKSEESEAERQKRLKGGDVLSDGGEGGDEKDEVVLTDAQKRVVRNLYPELPYKEAEARYIKSMGKGA